MRFSLVLIAVALLTALGIALTTTPAHAIKEFKDEFEARYSKPKTRKRADVAAAKALAKGIEQAQCTICHPGDNKHKLTAYGGEIAKLINRQDKANKAKVYDAFEKVAARRVDFYDRDSPTFGELLRKGKLPRAPWESPETGARTDQ